MGLIVPDAIERYLASLNHAGGGVLDDIARGNRERGLPLVDAEVGALLRTPAIAVNAAPQRDPADTHAIAGYNERLAARPDLLTTIVPLRDGVSISVKRAA